MGSKASSSKRKSKRDKISSKKKSKRRESKKRRRSYDSDTSSSDDDSLYMERRLSTTSKSGHRRRITKTKKRRRDSSLSAHSESSDSDSSSTDYNARKSRRSRVDSKDVKRKGRKRSISPIGDVDATSGRKRKRFDIDHATKPIKKSSKKNSKKVLSSSSGSASESCSTCQSGSSADGKRQRKKSVYGKEKQRLRGRGSDKRKKKHKERSPSSTSIRSGDPFDSVGTSDVEFFPVDNSRRLKSVIVFVSQAHDEENIWEKDPHKEEIVYDKNDYPSPKSLDSNEGGSKMESNNQFNVAFSDRIHIENKVGADVHELEKSGNNEGNHSNVGDRQSEGGYSEKEKEINMPVPVAALGGDDLESILRQKALENLRKFRERPRTCPRSNMVKINNEANVARLSGETVDVAQNKPIEQVSSDAKEIAEVVKLPDSEYVEKKPRIANLCFTQREIAEVVKLPDSEYVEKKPRIANLCFTQREIAEVVKLPDSEHIEKKPKLAKASITDSHNEAAPLDCSEKDRSADSQAVMAKSLSGSSNSPGAGGTKACGSSNAELTSSVDPTSGEHSSEKVNEAKDGSQFEQKTMSVMRGGEVVQVSYKVYIPKKPPGQARRLFRR